MGLSHRSSRHPLAMTSATFWAMTVMVISLFCLKIVDAECVSVRARANCSTIPLYGRTVIDVTGLENNPRGNRVLTEITGTYDVSRIKSGKFGSIDTVEFSRKADDKSAALQIALQFSRGGRGSVRLLGFRSSTGRPSPDGNVKNWLYKDDYLNTIFDGKKGNFTLQIWEEQDHYFISILNRSTGFSTLQFNTTFNYDDASVWNQYNYRVSEADRILINSDIFTSRPNSLGEMVKFEKVSHCSIPQSIPCSQPQESIYAKLGRTYTLSCDLSEVKSLPVKWSKSNELGQTESIAEGFYISEYRISDFSVHDIGNYTCKVFIPNVGKVTERKFSVQYSQKVNVLSAPSNFSFHADDGMRNLTWTAEGWPLSGVKLKCLSKTGEKVLTYQRNLSLEFSPPKISLAVTVDPNITSEVKCALHDGDSVPVLDIKVFKTCKADQKILQNGDCFPDRDSEHITPNRIETAVLSKPDNFSFFAEDGKTRFTWWLEGWLLQEVELGCVSETGKEVHTFQGNDSSGFTPPRISWAVTVDPEKAVEVACTLYNGQEILDQQHFKKIDCRDGQMTLFNGDCFTPYSAVYKVATYISIAVLSVIIVAQYLYLQYTKPKRNFAPLEPTREAVALSAC